MVIRGNHDKVAAGLDDGESFNSVARSAVLWTYEALTPANREYLDEVAGRTASRRRPAGDLPRHAV